MPFGKWHNLKVSFGRLLHIFLSVAANDNQDLDYLYHGINWAMLQKSLYHAPIMLRAVPLCPKHASTVLQLNAQLEYFT